MNSYSLLQGIFPVHGLNLGFLYCRQILYLLNHQESPAAAAAAAACCMHAKLLHSCLTLWSQKHMDRSPPGSSVHRILQARILEWVAISFSKGSPEARLIINSSSTARILGAHSRVSNLPLCQSFHSEIQKMENGLSTYLGMVVLETYNT